MPCCTRSSTASSAPAPSSTQSNESSPMPPSPSTPGAVRVTPTRATLTPAPAPAPPAARSGQPAPPSAVVPKPTAPPAAAAAGPVTPPAPSNRKTPPAPARASTTPPTIQETPNRPEQGRAATAPQNLLVQQSHRADVPSELPPPPMGAPSSRTVLSMSAGANAGTLTAESDHFRLALYYQKIGDFENALIQYRAVPQPTTTWRSSPTKPAAGRRRSLVTARFCSTARSAIQSSSPACAPG